MTQQQSRLAVAPAVEAVEERTLSPSIRYWSRDRPAGLTAREDYHRVVSLSWLLVVISTTKRLLAVNIVRQIIM